MMPVLLGLLVWIGGTIAVVLGAMRERASRPAEVPQYAVVVAAVAGVLLMFLAGIAVAVAYLLALKFLMT